jgi:predicted nucleotidyltransferase
VNQDFLDLLSAFNAAEVRYLVVGAYAVGVHGHPRATKDLDIWIEASAGNAARVMNALQAFGAPVGDLEVRDFETPGTGFMMGNPPRRIDVLTTIDGVRFDEVAPRAIEASFDGVSAKVIGLEDLLTNKRASGRLQDLADVRALERLRGLTSR